MRRADIRLSLTTRDRGKKVFPGGLGVWLVPIGYLENFLRIGPLVILMAHKGARILSYIERCMVSYEMSAFNRAVMVNQGDCMCGLFDFLSRSGVYG